jgi:hypothetical protein
MIASNVLEEETLLWLRLRERHARHIEVLGDINSSHAFAPEIIRD